MSDVEGKEKTGHVKEVRKEKGHTKKGHGKMAVTNEKAQTSKKSTKGDTAKAMAPKKSPPKKPGTKRATKGDIANAKGAQKSPPTTTTAKKTAKGDTDRAKGDTAKAKSPKNVLPLQLLQRMQPRVTLPEPRAKVRSLLWTMTVMRIHWIWIMRKASPRLWLKYVRSQL